ncbi:MAG: pentapeptide repeat-containing protein [Verrucomicrobia bacterium]|nr:pentapeptide repeat-containing protein [Verrucomicrobiota bacterium]
MSENPNLPERVAALEQAIAQTNRRRTGFPRWSVFVFLLALVTWNGWLLARLESSRRQSGVEHHFWVVGHAANPARARAESFLELLGAHNTEWSGAHLNKLDLTAVGLPGADLAGATLEACNFTKSTLTATKFTKAKLQLTDFTEADLSNADLSGADLFKTRFAHARLLSAKLRGANLEQVQAPAAVLAGADLSDAYLLMADLSGANLFGANFADANLEAANLSGANLSQARLNGVRLEKTLLTDANWWRARGFTTEQLAMLKEKFPPSEKAPSTVREDYQAWLKSPTGK